MFFYLEQSLYMVQCSFLTPGTICTYATGAGDHSNTIKTTFYQKKLFLIDSFSAFSCYVYPCCLKASYKLKSKVLFILLIYASTTENLFSLIRPYKWWKAGGHKPQHFPLPCCGMEDRTVVDHGCRKTKKLICGMEGKK